VGTVAIVGIDHSGGEQLDEQEHGKLTHRGGRVEKHRLLKLDANDEVDDHCHARKEETAGHSFAVEHQEEGQIDERRTRLSLSYDTDHRHEDDAAGRSKVLEVVDVKSIGAHEFGYGEGSGKLGKLGRLQS